MSGIGPYFHILVRLTLRNIVQVLRFFTNEFNYDLNVCEMKKKLANIKLSNF